MKKLKLNTAKLQLKKKEIIALSNASEVKGGATNSIQITGCGGSQFCTNFGPCKPEPTGPMISWDMCTWDTVCNCA